MTNIITIDDIKRVRDKNLNHYAIFSVGNNILILPYDKQKMTTDKLNLLEPNLFLNTEADIAFWIRNGAYIGDIVFNAKREFEMLEKYMKNSVNTKKAENDKNKNPEILEAYG